MPIRFNKALKWHVNWQTLDYPLTDYAGKTVGIVVKVSYGGKIKALNEEAFFDEISVIERP